MNSSHRLFTRALTSSWTFTMILAMSGCIYLPALDRPTWNGRSIPSAVGDSAGSLRSLSREDLLLKVGEPDWVAREGLVFVYGWQTLEGVLIVAGPGGGGAAEVTSTQFLLVQLDDTGTVVRAERASAKWFQLTHDRVEQWINESP